MNNEMMEKLKLYADLVGCRNSGIRLFLLGVESTPEEIVDASMCCEGGESYMRDYIKNEEGETTEIHFDKVSNDWEEDSK
jgi:uncharacterized protein YqkB